MGNDIQTIDFHGDVLVCVLKDDVPHVSVRHVCDALGVDFSRQLRKLKTVSWGGVDMMSTPDSSGVVQTYAMIPVRVLAMWMATVNPRKVGADVRLKLERYQVEAADVLDRYFRRGQRFAAPVDAPGDGASLLDRLIQQTDVFRQSLLVAAEHERRLTATESRVDDLIRRLDAADEERRLAAAGLLALPAPDARVPAKTPIDDLVRLIRGYCGSTGLQHHEAWRRLYEEIRIRLHYDVYARVAKYPHGITKLNVIRMEAPRGVSLQDFHDRVYAIAYELLARTEDGAAIEEPPATVPMSTPVAPPVAAAARTSGPWPLPKAPESAYAADPAALAPPSDEPY